MFFKDPFKLVPVEKIADIADKFTRNEILSSNELRGIVGFKPVQDPRADELRNSNLNREENQEFPMADDMPNTEQFQNGSGADVPGETYGQPEEVQQLL